MSRNKRVSREDLFNIKPLARHVLTIGRDLIKDNNTALLELVKNSYDADATKVDITFSATENSINISISDNGEGMSFKTVTTVWMVPSTSYKQGLLRSSTKNRSLQGRKGIGRYAASILGDILHLETIKDGEATAIFMDWREFEKEKYLDEVQIKIQKKSTRSAAGTRVEITGDRDNLLEWDALQIDKLVKDLRRLISPVHGAEEKQDFEIKVTFNDFPISEYKDRVITIEPFPILEVSDYRIYGEVSDTGDAELFFVNGVAGTPVEKIPKFNIPLDNGARYCGILKIDFKIYDRDAESISQLIEKIDKKGFHYKSDEKLSKTEVRKLLDDICGISVYRTGFRIRPHGDPGYDWLLLDRRRVQKPGIRVGSDRVSGFIEIQPEEKSRLEEKANREGLKENKYYDGLVLQVTRVLLEAENRRYQFKLKTGKERSQKGLADKLDRLFDFSDVTQSIDNQLATHHVSAPERKKIVDLIDARVEESNRVIEDVKRIIAIYQGQATLGKIIRVVLHEGRNPLSYFQNQIPLIEKWIHALKTGPNPTVLDQLSGALVIFTKQVQFVVDLFRKISPLAAQRRPSPSVFEVKKILEEVISIFFAELKKNKIQVKLICNEKVQFTGWAEDFNQAFINLIDNSLYWLSHSQKEGQKTIIITVTSGVDGLKIAYKDNGPGIEEKFILDELIFEPGFTTKPSGTGLGLAIAGEAVERNDGKLIAIHSDEGAYFEADFPFANK